MTMNFYAPSMFDSIKIRLIKRSFAVLINSRFFFFFFFFLVCKKMIKCETTAYMNFNVSNFNVSFYRA